MGAAKLRRLSIDGAAYLWRVGSRSVARGRSTMLLTAYLADKKLAPLLMSFVTWDDAIAGNPLNTGWPFELMSVNLNRPRFVAELIRAARNKGWMPETARRPFAIEDGVAMLVELGYDADVLRPR